MTTLEAPIGVPVDLPRPGAWSLHWRGKTFHESQVTGQHLATLALLTGSDNFESLDLDPRHGHQRLMQMLMAFITVEASVGVTEGDDLAGVIAAAIDEVSKATADELLGSLRYD